MGRYTLSLHIPKEEKAKGMVCEVIDRTHPSDGGPVAIEWHPTVKLGENSVELLNEANDELIFESRS